MTVLRMNKRKSLRSRCKNEFCQKQFRHAYPSAEFCSAACRQAVYRIRQKAKQEEPVLSEKYARIAAALRKPEAQRQAELERARSAPKPVEEQRRPSEPAAPAYKPIPGYLPTRGLNEEAPRPFTIVVPRRPPITPLNRGRRG